MTSKIKLTKGLYATVDKDSAALLAEFNWCASNESRGTKWYAIRWKSKKKIRMHHVVLGVTADELRARGMVVDHINHNGLDNRRENLREITQRENMLSTKGWRRAPTEPYL